MGQKVVKKVVKVKQGLVKRLVKGKQGLVKKVLKTLDSYMAIDPRKGLKPQGLQWQKRW